jgi:hypothetical protein
MRKTPVVAAGDAPGVSRIYDGAERLGAGAK